MPSSLRRGLEGATSTAVSAPGSMREDRGGGVPSGDWPERAAWMMRVASVRSPERVLRVALRMASVKSGLMSVSLRFR